MLVMCYDANIKLNEINITLLLLLKIKIIKHFAIVSKVFKGFSTHVCALFYSNLQI